MESGSLFHGACLPAPVSRRLSHSSLKEVFFVKTPSVRADGVDLLAVFFGSNNNLSEWPASDAEEWRSPWQ